MSPRGIPLTLVVLAALVAGCGGSDGGERQTVTVTNPVASTPDATTPPPDATQPGTTAVTPPATTQTQPPPASGDEQRVRVPASFAIVAPGRLDPPAITVPPFLAVEVSARSDDGGAHRLVVRTPRPRTLDVPAGGRDAVQVPGLRAGTYPVELDGRRAGELIVGGEVGP